MGVVWEGWLAVGLSYDLHRKVGGMAVPVKPHPFMRDEKNACPLRIPDTHFFWSFGYTTNPEKKKKKNCCGMG